MSIEQTDVVDAIGVQQESGEVFLTITDHLDWKGGNQNHLLLLQEKVNTYLAFVESGELLETYPDAKDRAVVINIVGKYPLSDEARQFIKQASSVISGAGMKLNFEPFQAA